MTILKFTKADMLNSTLVTPETGAPVFTILTRSHFIRANGRDSDTESEDEDSATQRTIITNKTGRTVAEIAWKGRQPVEVVIGKEKINVKGMFGTKSAILSQNVVGLPTRFDPELFWLAAPSGLSLLDYESSQTRGQYHVNAIRVGDKLRAAPIAGFGNDYLEFDSHPDAPTEEFIVSFILVETMRRGRFNLNPHKPWTENLASIGRKIRRSSV
ncbi:hypothetical protein CONPUDRAFT_162217 [Coniophora puteana RWD-64-598 SS2]|uniref:Uncharacterized protein n=1 Tax=Coniophora puteana (strain RWD-64-598) TaxID=741705 RepID=A0A5M3N1V4_CONPW|nr:uncharacterized protein CONPUDRAFT_162217 [Coniophora puteana RWD-64-598 SS2]EIW84895.1 hypothetical protein CONPUDRAFT_162217 [Coniophora puteana RWD-64-598 SS2]